MQLFDRVPLRTLPPNLITASGMIVGMLSVAWSTQSRFATAAWFIALATLIDKLDGTVARAVKGSSAFGVQFDSFSDFVAFGMAPAALVFLSAPALAPADWGPGAAPVLGLIAPDQALMAICLLYAVLASVRLAKFNITTAEHPIYFQGLPTTLSGGLVALCFLALPQLGVPVAQVAAFLPAMLLINSVLMICNLPLPKLRLWKHPALRAFQIGSAVAIYVLIPLQLALWYPLAVLVTYIVVGFAAGVRDPAARGPHAEVEAEVEVEVAG